MDFAEKHLKIRVDNLENKQVIDLLKEHLNSMEHTAPAESRHALDINGLLEDGVTCWSIWDDSQLAGFGALKHLSKDHAEIKSMKTSVNYLRKGVASSILKYIIQEAQTRGYARLSLETGSMDFFAPARILYTSFGFKSCSSFGSYKEDPNSVFMTSSLKR